MNPGEILANNVCRLRKAAGLTRESLSLALVLKTHIFPTGTYEYEPRFR